jgi:protein arginine kinase
MNDKNIAISSRIRVARNIEGYKFPGKASNTEAEEIIELIKTAFNRCELSSKLLSMDIESLTEVDKLSLLEKHLISPDFIKSGKKKAVLITEDEKVSAMLMEEDHMRLQVICSGQNLKNGWEKALQILGGLTETLDFSFQSDYGYLTSCPTNTGTGLRASVMLHLPALTITGYINKILDASRKLGVVIRGIYGEGSKALGNIYQVSNQVTLGLPEERILDEVIRVANQIIDREDKFRENLLINSKIKIEDRVYRSLGILKNARIISSVEGLKLISDVLFGLDLGIIKDISSKKLLELQTQIQPGNLQKNAGKPMEEEEQDILRSEMIRECLFK